MRDKFKHVYGPVASRRLGQSLGIDLIPHKTCSYDCIYCQLGRTTNKTIARREYVQAIDVLEELREKLSSGVPCDYISLAGCGEPTLHSSIGEIIDNIKKMTNIPVAVLTNGSLLYLSEVQEALMKSDLVIPSLDAGDLRVDGQSVSAVELVDGSTVQCQRLVVTSIGRTSTPWFIASRTICAGA